MSTFALPRALRADVAAVATARPALPRDRVRPRRRGLRTGPGVHAWTPGDEVVAHCLSVELRAPTGTTTRCSTRSSASGGSRPTSAAGPARAGQEQPADAQAGAPVVGGGGLSRTRQLDGVPPARLENGAGMKQGDVVLIWGASGGLGSYATQLALGGGATPVCVVSSEEKAEICRSMGADLIIDRAAEDYRFWSDEHTQDPKEWQRLGQADPRAHRRRRPGHRLRAPWPWTFGARSSWREGRHDRHLRLDQRLPARVRQPLPLDEPQADHRVALRQLPRGLGGQPPDRRGAHPPDPVADLPARPDRPGRVRRARNLHQGKVGVLCLAPEEGLGVRNQARATSTSMRSTGSGMSDMTGRL